MARPRKVKPKYPPLPRRPRGTGSIQRLADGRLRARPPAWADPKRTAREFGPDQLASAEAYLDAVMAQARGIAPTATVETVLQWAGYWLETFVAPFRPPNTVRKYLYALRQLEPLYQARLSTLVPSQLQELVGGLTARLAADNVTAIVGVWRRCLERARDDGLMARNPARGLVLPKASRQTTRRHLTAKEFGIVWAAIEGERFEPAFALMLGCGLRIGSILGLHWVNVDFAGKRIWVADQFTNNHWRDVPKGGVPYWTPMPPRVAAALLRHREHHQPSGCTLVLESPYRGRRSKHHTRPMPWSRDAIVRDLRAVIARTGLDHFSPHAGRHGLVTYLLEGGVPPATVAERVGHANAAITTRFYAHATEASQQRADALVAALSGAPDGVFEGVSGDLGDDLGGSEERPSESDPE